MWFSEGPLIEPILASAALPAVLPPVEIDGVRYMDGAVLNDVPVTRAVDLGATRVYVLHTGTFDRPRPEPRRPLDVALQAYWIARRARFQRDLAALPPDVEVTILPTGEAPVVRFNDLRQSRSADRRAPTRPRPRPSGRAAGCRSRSKGWRRPFPATPCEPNGPFGPSSKDAQVTDRIGEQQQAPRDIGVALTPKETPGNDDPVEHPRRLPAGPLR